MSITNIFKKTKTKEIQEPEQVQQVEEEVDESNIRFKNAIALVNNIKYKQVNAVIEYLKVLKETHDVDYRDAIEMTLNLASDVEQDEANLFCGQILVDLATKLNVQFDVKEIIAELIDHDKFYKVADLMKHPDFTLKFVHQGKQYDLVDTAIKLNEVNMVEQLIRHDKNYNDLSEIFKSLEEIENEHSKCLEARSLAEIIATKYDQGIRFNFSYIEEGKIKSNKQNIRRLSEYLSYFTDDQALYLKDVIDNADLSKMFAFVGISDIKKDIITNMKIVNETNADREWTAIDDQFVEKIYSKNLKDIFPNKLQDEKQAISFIANLYEFAFVNNLNNVIGALDKTCEQSQKVKKPIISIFQELKTIKDTNELMDRLVKGIKNSSATEINVAARIIANHELFPIEDIQRIFHHKPLSMLDFDRIDTDRLFNKSVDISDTFMMATLLDKLPKEKIKEIMQQVIENSDYEFFDAILDHAGCSIYFKKQINQLSNHYTNSGESKFLDGLIDKGIFGNDEIRQLPITYQKSKGYRFKDNTAEPTITYIKN